jgi:FtsP/CotA-like multicopper oxidase with cupredoxin domain
VLPATLLPNMPDDLGLPESKAVQTRQWRFERHGGQWAINQLTTGFEAFINGRRIDFNNPADDGRIDAVVRAGSSEIWEFVNKSGGWLHPVHPHLVRFRVLSRNGRPPRPWEIGGRKDVVALGPNETVRVIMQFVDFTGRYVFHCHLLGHEDNDMMSQFKVV